MARKSNQPMRTQGGSPIYRVPVDTQYSGSMTVDTPYGMVERVRGEYANIARVRDAKGNIHEIVVNPRTGRVSEEAMVEHMLNAGNASGGKRSVTGDMVRGTKIRLKVPKGGFTPEEIVASGWWQDPGSIDIEGLDDGTSRYIPENGRLRRIAGGRILIKGAAKDKKRIESVLAENFTEDELRAAAQAGLYIRRIPEAETVGGGYSRRQPTHETARIKINSPEPETITHEFVHHLRYTDPSRTGINRHYYPDDVEILDKNGIPKGFSKETASNFEEAMTVAESQARLSAPPERSNGYYAHVGRTGRSSIDMSRADYGTLTQTGPIKGPKRGKWVQRALDENFEKTFISNLRVNGRGMAPRDFAPQMRSDRAVRVGRGRR